MRLFYVPVRNFHIARLVIRFAESPLIVGRSRTLAVTGMPEYRSVIPDRVSFVFIDTFCLALKIVYIYHMDKGVKFLKNDMAIFLYYV